MNTEAAATSAPRTPTPVMGLHDAPMWGSIGARRMRLQCCRACGAWQYPPAPGCCACLATELDWKPVSGEGRIVSWAIFRRQYLDAYPAPYNVIAVRLAEGPIMVSNLEGPEPEGEWIGQAVRLIYATMPDGAILPRFRLAS